MLSESRQLLGQVSRARMEIRSWRILESRCSVWAKLYFARAVLQCLESESERTRAHFTKKVRFVTALAITGRRPCPGIAKQKRIWQQRGATFVVVSGMNLARKGS